MRYMFTQIFEHFFLKILVSFDFHPFQNFGLNGLLFGNSTISGFSGMFPWKVPLHLSRFKKFQNFWLIGKCPKLHVIFPFSTFHLKFLESFFGYR